jgi:hypothetical protein
VTQPEPKESTPNIFDLLEEIGQIIDKTQQIFDEHDDLKSDPSPADEGTN